MAYKRISPEPIVEGGTSIQSATAYAPLVGGTTSTGALQSASSNIANAGWILLSQGSSSIPIWSTIPRTITSMFRATVNQELNSWGAFSNAHAVGSITPVSIINNVGSNGYAGNGTGTPASYTVPTTGYYLLYGTIGVKITTSSSATSASYFKLAIYAGEGSLAAWANGPTSIACSGYYGISNIIQISGGDVYQLSSSQVITWTVQGTNGTNVDTIVGGDIGIIFLGS